MTRSLSLNDEPTGTWAAYNGVRSPQALKPPPGEQGADEAFLTAGSPRRRRDARGCRDQAEQPALSTGRTARGLASSRGRAAAAKRRNPPARRNGGGERDRRL